MNTSRRQGRLIERGPTRADPTQDAWCSFCCRPRSEVGTLVAGPAGAFICLSCVRESGTLLGGGIPVPVGEPSSAVPPLALEGLVGQSSAWTLFELGLHTGLSRMLLVGPEGTGKTTFLQALEQEGRGVRVSIGTLDRVPLDTILLVDDVDRMTAAEQETLHTFLSRHPRCTVLLGARGSPPARGRVMRSDSIRLPLTSTAALSKAVQGTLSVSLLESVQLLVPFEHLGVPELIELARRRLAPREECKLSEDVLKAIATEAARSPRGGHELMALLERIPSGTWRLEKRKPVRRGRRKGTS